MKKYFLPALLLCFAAAPAHAQNALSVTVTPPLFQLTIGPGESWTSSVKVVNNNAYPVTYYAQVMDMQAQGEQGMSKFIPVVDEPQDPALATYALARWITISSAPLTVPAGQSEDVPFTVTIPQNAEPGGHYAAILIGTAPQGTSTPGTSMKVQSYVSSLLFVEVKGDVTESGRIREFSTDQSFYQSPNVDFTLRFENTGNTHLQPQGDITIYNMWGKERGQVLINQDTMFGNVLPQSIRRFQFSWQGTSDPFDIGLYSADVTLTFGSEAKHNVSAKVYFWVVPVVPVILGLGGFILFILLIAWFIRRYIRRALMLEQLRLGMTPGQQMPPQHPGTVETLIEPLREGVVDLRNIGRGRPQAVRQMPQAVVPRTYGQWIRKYRLFMIFIAIVALGCTILWLYFSKVSVGTRQFQITDVHIEAESATSSRP